MPGIPGENLGAIPGFTFEELNLGKEFDFTGKNVVVVGGGNVAMDAARSAKRLGAASVNVLPQAPGRMPAANEEIELLFKKELFQA